MKYLICADLLIPVANDHFPRKFKGTENLNTYRHPSPFESSSDKQTPTAVSEEEAWKAVLAYSKTHPKREEDHLPSLAAWKETLESLLREGHEIYFMSNFDDDRYIIPRYLEEVVGLSSEFIAFSPKDRADAKKIQCRLLYGTSEAYTMIKHAGAEACPQNVVFVCDVKEGLDAVVKNGKCLGIHFQNEDSFKLFDQFKDLEPIFNQVAMRAKLKSEYLVSMICYLESWYHTSDENPVKSRRWQTQLTTLRDTVIEIMIMVADEEERLQRLEHAVEATISDIQRFWRGLGSRLAITLTCLLDSVLERLQTHERLIGPEKTEIEGYVTISKDITPEKGIVQPKFVVQSFSEPFLLQSRTSVTLNYYELIRATIVDKVLSGFENYERNVVEWRENKLWGWWPFGTNELKQDTVKAIIRELETLKRQPLTEIDNSSEPHEYARAVFTRIQEVVHKNMPSSSSAIYNSGHFAGVFTSTNQFLEHPSSQALSVVDRVHCPHAKHSSEYLFVMIYRMHDLYLHPEVKPPKKQRWESIITELRNQAFNIMQTTSDEIQRNERLKVAVNQAKQKMLDISKLRSMNSRLYATLDYLVPGIFSNTGFVKGHILSAKTVTLDAGTILREDLIKQFLIIFEKYKTIVDARKNKTFLGINYSLTKTDSGKATVIEKIVRALNRLKDEAVEDKVENIHEYLTHLFQEIKIMIYDEVGEPSSTKRKDGHFEQGNMGTVVKEVDALITTLTQSLNVVHDAASLSSGNQ